ncbi:MAG: flagellar basal body P-ring formation protein FlgA [Chitinispirillaceae bacterium]|nr:flagellar basal body P-ring formation protein FlgA [Chitinispirillaceae bacterium]
MITKKIVIAALFVTGALGADDITLNFTDAISVNDSLITLSEIAQICGDNKKLVNELSGVIAGNAAPPGFSRLLGVDDMIMYRVKPRFPGVRFVTEGTKRVRVSTLCNIRTINEIRPEIEKYLDTALLWRDGEWSFEIANGNQLWRGYDAPFTVTIDGLLSRYAKGNTSLSCQFVQGTKKTSINVVCRIKVATEICAAIRDIERGTVLCEEDLEIITRDITSYAPGFYTNKGELVGLKTVITLNAGTIIQNRMICRIHDVTNGDNVEIVFNKGRIRCSVQGTARESGHTGDKIWVQNNETRQLLRVKILKKGTVEIV